jgi:hypothetical protein
MRIEDIKNQLEELQKVNFNAMTPEQLQAIVDQLLTFTEDAENQLNEDIQNQIKDEPKDS